MTLERTVSTKESDKKADLAEIERIEQQAQMLHSSDIFRQIKESQEGFASRHDLDRKAMLRMSALKRFSPLILALIHRPGPNGSNEDISEALQQMMDASYSLSSEVLEKIVGKKHPHSEFLQDQAITAVSEFVGTEWAFNSSTDVRDRVMCALDQLASSDDVVDAIARTTWDASGDHAFAELSAGLEMSMLKATEPILTALNDYDVNDTDLSKKLSDCLLDESMNYLSRISSNLPPHSRLAMIQNHLGISGRILKSSLVSVLSRNDSTLTSTASLAPVIAGWKKGLKILESAVETKVSIAISTEELLKPLNQKPKEMAP